MKAPLELAIVAAVCVSFVIWLVNGTVWQLIPIGIALWVGKVMKNVFDKH